MVYGLVGWDLVKERRRELVREADERRLARVARAPRPRRSRGEPGGGTGVRWGLAEDEPAVARLLELNGLPRWMAYEDRFIVAEGEGGIVGALGYRTESKRLLLGLLVVDPWAGERRVAGALYAGARGLAEELGANEVAAAGTGADYPRAAGYRRSGRAWRSPVPGPGDGPSGLWRRVFGLWGATDVPFHRAFRG